MRINIELVIGTCLALAVPASAQLRVACVGDSITYGVGVTNRTADSYPSVLQRLLPVGSVVENDGHSGATMLEAGNPSYWDQPEFTSATTFASVSGTQVVIMLGANDTKPANWPAHGPEFQASTEHMVDHFTALGAHVWLVLPPPAWDNTHGIDGTIIHDQILPILRAVAAERGVGLIDVYDALVVHMEYFMLDNIHPDEQGAALLAQTVADALLAVPTDGGVGIDGGVDGGSSRDAGIDARVASADGGSVPAAGGCGCVAAPMPMPISIWSWGALWFFRRRRV